MLSSIARDLRLYRLLITMQIRAQLQYKGSVILDILAYLAVTAFEFLGLLIVFGPFPTMLGWRVGEVAMLAAVMSTSFGLAELMGAGIDNFAETIRRGEFDRVLLRPLDPFTQVIGSDFRLRRLGRLTQGVLGFMLALKLLPAMLWTPAKILILFAGIASGAIIFLAILLLGATVCFWTVETTELTNILTYGGREMLSYPLTVYHAVLQRIFIFIIPLAFGSYIPTCYLLGKPLPFGLPNWLVFGAPVVALGFALVARLVWQYGVRHYQSTGS